MGRPSGAIQMFNVNW